MTEKQIRQIKEQLPKGSRYLCSYRAFEGDIRVIAKNPDKKTESRYTVKWDFENDYPKIELMP